MVKFTNGLKLVGIYFTLVCAISLCDLYARLLPPDTFGASCKHCFLYWEELACRSIELFSLLAL